MTDTYAYEAFGKGLSGTGSTPNKYRFAGEEQVATTGLYNLRARSYRPTTGSFLSRDPLPGVRRSPLSTHPYVYAHGNPQRYCDASGTQVTGAEAGAVVELTTPSFGWATDPFSPGGSSNLCTSKLERKMSKPNPRERLQSILYVVEKMDKYGWLYPTFGSQWGTGTPGAFHYMSEKPGGTVVCDGEPVEWVMQGATYEWGDVVIYEWVFIETVRPYSFLYQGLVSVIGHEGYHQRDPDCQEPPDVHTRICEGDPECERFADRLGADAVTWWDRYLLRGPDSCP